MRILQKYKEFKGRDHSYHQRVNEKENETNQRMRKDKKEVSCEKAT